MERRTEGKNGFMGCVCGFFAFYVRVFVFCGVFFWGVYVQVCVCVLQTRRCIDSHRLLTVWRYSDKGEEMQIHVKIISVSSLVANSAERSVYCTEYTRNISRTLHYIIKEYVNSNDNNNNKLLTYLFNEKNTLVTLRKNKQTKKQRYMLKSRRKKKI